MTLSIQRVHDFIEAHEIADQGQILAMTGLIGVRECSGHDVPKFRDIAHVNAPHGWIKRENPAHESVCQLLRSKNADKVLIVERRDDERMIGKPGFFHYPINLGLAGKVGNVELAPADSLYIRQR